MRHPAQRRGQARKQRRGWQHKGHGVGVVDWAWQGAKGMPACLLGLFLDHHRQETLPSYSLLGV